VLLGLLEVESTFKHGVFAALLAFFLSAPD